MKDKIESLLSQIIHPDSEKNIVDSGIVGSIECDEQRIFVSLHFQKKQDPFSTKIRKGVEARLKEEFADHKITVVIKEISAKQAQKGDKLKESTTTNNVANIIAVASGKGGVGKSTVTANLALSLTQMGYRVGVLDADIYGPSQPRMFNLEGYLPEAIATEEQLDRIIPGESMGVKVMSIGFFIKPSDALIWRGVMANSALKQLIHQTQWGELDFLLIDLPPGTGDIHISIVNELKVNSAVIVSTPQQVAVDDVRRGIELFTNNNVNIPIAGVIENMAWFTPEELPDNKYYIFGKGGAQAFAEEVGVEFLGEIPIVQSIMESAESGSAAIASSEVVKECYSKIGQKVVNSLSKGV